MTHCVHNGWPRRRQCLWNSSPLIRWNGTRQTYTARLMAMQTQAARSIRFRGSPDDRPVYRVDLHPDDGLYPLPYMARQADGSAWEEECTAPGSAQARQGFYPDGSRSFEEIDRLGIGDDGTAGLLSAIADVTFHRIQPPSGYIKGLPEGQRTDAGSGPVPPELRGRDFFPYKPWHLPAAPARPGLARTVNLVQQVMDSGAATVRSGPRAARRSKRLATGSIC